MLLCLELVTSYALQKILIYTIYMFCILLYEKPKEFADYLLAYKTCHSQFADTADYRRDGRNT